MFMLPVATPGQKTDFNVILDDNTDPFIMRSYMYLPGYINVSIHMVGSSQAVTPPA